MDSTSSYEVIAALRHLADKKCTVACSIPSPSKKIYSLFDKVLLLSEGKIVYYGKAEFVQDYFTNTFYQFPFKEDINPAEYIITIASGAAFSHDGVLVSIMDIVSVYNNSDLYVDLLKDINEKLLLLEENRLHLKRNTKVNDKNNDINNSYYNSSTWNQVKILLHRKVIIRSKSTNDKIKFLLYV